MTEERYKDWTREQEHIIRDCHIVRANLDKVHDHMFREEYDGLHGFLVHLRSQYYFTLATQLAKLFCEGQHHLSFPKLLSELRASDGHFLTARFQQNMANRNQRELPKNWENADELRIGLAVINQNMSAKSQPIEKLKNLRNRVYAHTDHKEKREHARANAPYVSEVSELIDLAAEIYHEINCNLGFSAMAFDVIQSWDISPVFDSWRNSRDFQHFKQELLDQKSGEAIVTMNRATGIVSLVSSTNRKHP
jgi:hypothetical protein